MYFFSNISPKKLSWQNNVLISRETIRVLALPSAAAETAEPMQCLSYSPYYLPQHWAVLDTCSKLIEELYQFYKKRVKISLVDESHVLLHDPVSLGIPRRSEGPLCSYLQGVSLLLNQRRRKRPSFTVTRMPSFTTPDTVTLQVTTHRPLTIPIV